MKLMHVDEIPVYITDDNAIQCNIADSVDCEGTLLDSLGMGRRHVLGDVVDAIASHARLVHNLSVADHPPRA